MPEIHENLPTIPPRRPRLSPLLASPASFSIVMAVLKFSSRKSPYIQHSQTDTQQMLNTSLPLIGGIAIRRVC